MLYFADTNFHNEGSWVRHRSSCFSLLALLSFLIRYCAAFVCMVVSVKQFHWLHCHGKAICSAFFLRYFRIFAIVYACFCICSYCSNLHALCVLCCQTKVCFNVFILFETTFIFISVSLCGFWLCGEIRMHQNGPKALRWWRMRHYATPTKMCLFFFSLTMLFFTRTRSRCNCVRIPFSRNGKLKTKRFNAIRARKERRAETTTGTIVRNPRAIRAAAVV